MAVCKQCKAWFQMSWEDEEWGRGLCDSCEEIAILRSQQRAEWNSYHDESCPEIELTPMPKKATP